VLFWTFTFTTRAQSGGDMLKLCLGGAGWAVLLFLGVLFPGLAQAADIAGSKDPLNFKRFKGSQIISYRTRSFDAYLMARGGGSSETGFAKSETVEGAITRVIYRVPGGHTGLELLRNDEHMLADAGYTQTFELVPCGQQDSGPSFLGGDTKPIAPNDNDASKAKNRRVELKKLT
jgi:hypothetical protein